MKYIFNTIFSFIVSHSRIQTVCTINYRENEIWQNITLIDVINFRY